MYCETCAFLGYYAVSSDNFLHIAWPKTSTRNYYLLCKNPEERSSHPLCGRSLKSYIMYWYSDNMQHPQASNEGTQKHLLYLYNLRQDYKSVLGTKNRSQKFSVAGFYWIHYKIILETHLSNFSFPSANLTAGLLKTAAAATLEECAFSTESEDEVGSLPERTFPRGRGKWMVPRRWYPTIWMPSVSRYINYVYGQFTSGHKSIWDKMHNRL